MSGQCRVTRKTVETTIINSIIEADFLEVRAKRKTEETNKTCPSVKQKSYLLFYYYFFSILDMDAFLLGGYRHTHQIKTWGVYDICHNVTFAIGIQIF